MPSGIRQLQAELTVAGRPDWVENLYGAQLTWPTEYLAIVIRPCLLGHCPRHTREMTPATKDRADRVTWRCERTARKLERAGWVVVDVWDCSLLTRAKEVAEMTLEALESRETFVDAHAANGKKKTPHESALGAGVAKTMALRFCTEDEWIEFLSTLAGYYIYDRKNARRRAIRELFQTWSDKKFRRIWSIARHEMLVELRQGQIYIGPCMAPACDDIGLPKPAYIEDMPVPKRKKGRRGPKKKTEEERKGITVYVDDVPGEVEGSGEERGLVDPREL